mmetsp:Transcript_10043/g.46020  ORF Transcript_10043/g.46020 Transcript_10043/m.46020 type:complete len:212 (+) Transcript_10043:1986-2621(+)
MAMNVGCDVAARCLPAHCFAPSVSALNAQTRTCGLDLAIRSASCFHVGYAPMHASESGTSTSSKTSASLRPEASPPGDTPRNTLRGMSCSTSALVSGVTFPLAMCWNGARHDSWPFCVSLPGMSLRVLRAGFACAFFGAGGLVAFAALGSSAGLRSTFFGGAVGAGPSKGSSRANRLRGFFGGTRVLTGSAPGGDLDLMSVFTGTFNVFPS